MKKVFFWVMVVGGYFSPWANYAQDDQRIMVEESAEVFLEEYSDEFQENFFEGLKQKGIQNYDKAITYFENCKRLEPGNKVIAFELAKSYLLEKELQVAQEYAMEAVNGDPGKLLVRGNLGGYYCRQKIGFSRGDFRITMEQCGLERKYG